MANWHSQNVNRNANCKFRGSDTTAVDAPNDEFDGVVFGVSKLGWFPTL